MLITEKDYKYFIFQHFCQILINNSTKLKPYSIFVTNKTCCFRNTVFIEIIEIVNENKVSIMIILFVR